MILLDEDDASGSLEWVIHKHLSASSVVGDRNGAFSAFRGLLGMSSSSADW